MSQGSLILPTTGTLSGLALVQAVNAALANLAGMASGSTDPSTLPGGVLPYSRWMDTSATPPVIRQRSADNTSWVGAEVAPGRALGTVMSKSSTYAAVPVADYDNIINFTAAGDYQLPTAAAAGIGWKVSIGNASTFAVPVQVRILRASTDTIDQDATSTVYVLPGEVVEIRSDGVSKWWTRGRTPKGRVINIAAYSDSGSTNTPTSPLNAQAANFSYQPISPNSLLEIQWSFQGNIANLASTNTSGSYTGYEVTSGNVALGAVYNVSAPSAAGGVGAQAPGIVLVPSLANAVLTARLFALFQQTNTASAAVSALAIKCKIREIQNA